LTVAHLEGFRRSRHNIHTEGEGHMQKTHRAILAGAVALALGAGPAVAVVTNTTIYAIQTGAFALNDSVLVDSVVVIGVDVKPGSYGVYVQEKLGGAYSGILAFTNTIFPAYEPPSPPNTQPVVGDLLNVKGRYTEFSGFSEIINPVFTKLGTVTPLLPVKLPVDSLKNSYGSGTTYGGSERWEGVLIRVDSVKVTSLNTFNDWRFHMTTGPAAGQVDSIVGYEKMIAGQVIPEIGDVLSVVGVGDWFVGDRRIAPRNDNDITFVSPAPAAVPVIAWASAENKVKVRFNVRLNTTDAQTTSKYSIVPLTAISSAVYDDANKMVTLTFGSNLTPSTTPHILSMSGIRNFQNTAMVGTQAVSFIGGISTIQFVQTPKSASNDSSQVTNQQVSIRGVVTETTGGATPDFPAAAGGFFMQQRGATIYAGIFVFGAPSTPVKNDSVFVSGLVQDFGVGPETEIVSVDEITVLSSNRPPIDPIAVTLADASGSDPAEAEKYEGALIKISNVYSLTQAGPGTPFNISQSVSGGTDTLNVDDLAVEESAYIPWRGDNVDVTGLIHFSGTAPFRRLQPRNWNEPPTGDIHVISKAQVSDVESPRYRTELLQNHPNPFNPRTEISFTLDAVADVTLRVYSVDGRIVRTVFHGRAAAGWNRFEWDGRNEAGAAMPSGVYLYRLVTPEAIQTRKLMLLK
jgi:hypothetical protein